MSTRKRAFRYRITASEGCLAEQAPPGSHVIDWHDRGPVTDWNVVDFKSGKSAGFMVGEYVDAGWKGEDGKFVSDADSSTSRGCSHTPQREREQPQREGNQ